jgi:hypothetical protein
MLLGVMWQKLADVSEATPHDGEVITSETSVNFFQTTRRNIPKGIFLILVVVKTRNLISSPSTRRRKQNELPKRCGFNTTMKIDKVKKHRLHLIWLGRVGLAEQTISQAGPVSSEFLYTLFLGPPTQRVRTPYAGDCLMRPDYEADKPPPPNFTSCTSFQDVLQPLF